MTSPKNTGPEQEPKNGNLEAAKTPELSSFLSSLGALRESIKNNDPLSKDDVRLIAEKAKNILVQHGENVYALVDAKDDHNIGIWVEIIAGNFDRMKELTELPAFIVRDAPLEPPRTGSDETKCRQWDCPKLTTLTFETAQALSKRNDQIALELSTDFSRATAEVLAQHNTLLRQWAHIDSFHSATRLTPEWAHALFSGLENHSGSVCSHGFNALDFRSLESITAEAAKEMYWIPKNGKTGTGSNKGEGWEAVMLPVLGHLDLETAKVMATNRHLPTVFIGMDTVFENPEVAATLLAQKRVRTLAKHVVQRGRLRWEPEIEDYDELIFNNRDIPEWMISYHLAKTPNTKKIFFMAGRSIDDALIDALSSFEGEIYFGPCGPTDLTLLKKVSEMRAKSIALELGPLSVPMVETLSSFQGKIDFGNIGAIDLSVVEAVSRMASRKVGLNGITSASPEIVTALAKIWNRIDLGSDGIWLQVYKEKKRLFPGS